MREITILTITLPFFIGFVIYLFPKLDRQFALLITLISVAYSVDLFLQPSGQEIELLDNFGVILAIDKNSGFMVLANALVTIAVILYCWGSEKTSFFYMQTVILHGSINATFVCADFISTYVALEVASIAAFLLIVYPRSDHTLWVGLRYLFVSNTAMLFYLIGAVELYQINHSFYFGGLQNAPPEAIACIFLGLLVKGGVFMSGLWLPGTYSELETGASAMISGIVGKAAVFPLVRCALMVEEIDPVVRMFAVATALLGVSYAIFEQDTKRALAFSSIAQMGFVMAAPVYGSFYALTHSLVKSALFLITGNLPSRNFQELRKQPIDNKIWIALVIASFSICGLPLLSGFGAKVLVLANVKSWQLTALEVSTIGTVINFAKFIFIPHQNIKEKGEIEPGLWIAMFILLGGLIAANGFYYQQTYTLSNLVAALAKVAIGWLVYFLLFRHLEIRLPRESEKFEHLIGFMSLMLILLLGIVWTRSLILI